MAWLRVRVSSRVVWGLVRVSERGRNKIESRGILLKLGAVLLCEAIESKSRETHKRQNSIIYQTALFATLVLKQAVLTP